MLVYVLSLSITFRPDEEKEKIGPSKPALSTSMLIPGKPMEPGKSVLMPPMGKPPGNLPPQMPNMAMPSMPPPMPPQGMLSQPGLMMMPRPPTGPPMRPPPMLCMYLFYWLS